MASDREETVGLLNRIDNWWHRDSNIDEPFKHMTLSTEKASTIQREISTVIGRYSDLWSMAMSTRFVLIYRCRFDNISVMDLYHGRELRLQIEDRSSSGHDLGSWKCGTFEFIDQEDPRFAICCFLQEIPFLSVLEVDLNDGKVIVHQLRQLTFIGNGFAFNMRLARIKIILDRQAFASNIKSIHWFEPEFSSVFLHNRFDLEVQNGVPVIVSLSNDRERRLDVGFSHALVNQKSYSFNRRERSVITMYKELIVQDLSVPLDINDEHPQTMFQLHGFQEKHFRRSMQHKNIGNRIYFAYLDNDNREIVILCLDLKHKLWIDFYSYKCDKFYHSFNFELNKSELRLTLVEECRSVPRESEIRNHFLLPIGQPFLLTKLCIFEVRYLGQKNSVYNQILEHVNLFSPIRPLDGSQKCKSTKDGDFLEFCTLQAQTRQTPNSYW